MAGGEAMEVDMESEAAVLPFPLYRLPAELLEGITQRVRSGTRVQLERTSRRVSLAVRGGGWRYASMMRLYVDVLSSSAPSLGLIVNGRMLSGDATVAMVERMRWFARRVHSLTDFRIRQKYDFSFDFCQEHSAAEQILLELLALGGRVKLRRVLLEVTGGFAGCEQVAELIRLSRATLQELTLGCVNERGDFPLMTSVCTSLVGASKLTALDIANALPVCDHRMSAEVRDALRNVFATSRLKRVALDVGYASADELCQLLAPVADCLEDLTLAGAHQSLFNRLFQDAASLWPAALSLQRVCLQRETVNPHIPMHHQLISSAQTFVVDRFRVSVHCISEAVGRYFNMGLPQRLRLMLRYVAAPPAESAEASELSLLQVLGADGARHVEPLRPPRLRALAGLDALPPVDDDDDDDDTAALSWTSGSDHGPLDTVIRVSRGRFTVDVCIKERRHYTPPPPPPPPPSREMDVLVSADLWSHLRFMLRGTRTPTQDDWQRFAQTVVPTMPRHVQKEAMRWLATRATIAYGACGGADCDKCKHGACGGNASDWDSDDDQPGPSNAI